MPSESKVSVNGGWNFHRVSQYFFGHPICVYMYILVAVMLCEVLYAWEKFEAFLLSAMLPLVSFRRKIFQNGAGACEFAIGKSFSIYRG